MKLVGATDWFIRWPFVIEGDRARRARRRLAVLLLGVGKVALLDPLVDGLRAARRAGDDRLRGAGAILLLARRRRVGAAARACRCGASCASDLSDRCRR